MTAFRSQRFTGAMAIAMTAGILMLSSPAQVAAEEQPAMRDAIEHLRKAEAALQRASSDKGGHRVNALGLVREAIVETRKGIRADNRN
jgi:hypothetical protein